MGGRYPRGWEYNFAGVDKDATAIVLEHWPANVPLTFLGYELGKPILSGQRLRETAPSDSPVLAAYEYYVGRCGSVRESWDPITVLYAVLGVEGLPDVGLESPFRLAGAGGINSFDVESGENVWVEGALAPGSEPMQHYLELKDGVDNASVAEMLNKLYSLDPEKGGCPLDWEDVVEPY